ncbi:DUF4192 domain-containing protein [Kitasatospora sp. MBT63]|uniref:DUF4192 domain-containing protein n=1 Tax=Kitasatospora sp. MBT63 TaxID=1444768 RepID=UPI00068A7B37|nr:DUF4192 domain-containing protein [Kitasatospora sp. MBT63]
MNDERTSTPPGPLPDPVPGPLPGLRSDPLAGQLPVRMRGPADMAEMLPYLLGFFPDDSIVVVGLQGPELQQGGVIRVDIPDEPAAWPRVAGDTARLLVELSERRDERPAQVLVYLCRDPDAEVGPGRAVLAGLAPLAAALSEAFEREGVGVKESLCVSAGRWWSFLCTGSGCCDPGGTPIRSNLGPGPLAAAATFAGLAPRGSRKAIVAGLAPVGDPEADALREAIEQAGAPFIRELAGPGGRTEAVARTAELLAGAITEFRAGARSIDATRVARLLVGLQDKLGRDRAAEYTEPDELVAAQRLWRFLSRRCVPPFEHLAPPPMTLLAWTAWLAGDTATARIVLSRALDIDPKYTLAQLLHESINGGLMPDRLLESVRQERAGRAVLPDHPGALGPPPRSRRAEPPDGRAEPPGRRAEPPSGRGEPPSHPAEPAGGRPAEATPPPRHETRTHTTSTGHKATRGRRDEASEGPPSDPAQPSTPSTYTADGRTAERGAEVTGDEWAGGGRAAATGAVPRRRPARRRRLRLPVQRRPQDRPAEA